MHTEEKICSRIWISLHNFGQHDIKIDHIFYTERQKKLITSSERHIKIQSKNEL